MVDNHIEGRLALVTGASGGIGSACALRLALAGASLALAYSSNLSSVQSVVDSIHESCKASNLTPKITYHKADVSQPSDVQNLCEEVVKQHERGVDILVSNAGYGKRITDILEISVEEFDKMYSVNLRASFLLSKGIVAHMQAQKWGRIVFISSIAAIGAGINGCHYAASKAGLQGMMKNLAQKLAAYNISVNDVAPAMVGATGMIPSEESVPGVVDTIPMKRLCTPEEVANTVLMFVGTGFVTGQSLIVAGGLR